MLLKWQKISVTTNKLSHLSVEHPTVGTGIDGVLRTLRGLNLMQLAAARSIGPPVLGSVERWAGDGKVRSETGNISQAEPTQEGIVVKYTATRIVHHGRQNNISEIVDYLRLDPYKEWSGF